MKKRLYLSSIEDKLATDMWGEIIDKKELIKGVKLYICKYYKGFIFNDKEFDVEKRLKKKLNPMVIMEIYTYYNERFVIERTSKEENIPDKLKSKYENKKFDERINIYALTEESMNILKYYHREIIRIIYKNKLDEKSKNYKSQGGYVNSEIKKIVKYLSLNAPDFIKKKDKKRAKKYINKAMEEKVNLITKKDEKISKDTLENIKDKYIQRTEILCG
ncbi:MAG: hypothetical protein FH753_03725 [Firmicutes bacterium]|nr:hypothetical protein [Bacillota bacterium]